MVKGEARPAIIKLGITAESVFIVGELVSRAKPATSGFEAAFINFTYAYAHYSNAYMKLAHGSRCHYLFINGGVRRRAISMAG